MKKLLAAIVLAITTATAQAADAPVTLSAEDQARHGLVVEALTSREISDAEPAFVRVLDPAPFAAIESERAIAAAAVRASRLQLKRLSKLAGEDQSASQQAVEAAQAQAATDQSRLDLLTQRLAFEWGPKIAAMPDAARASLLRDLVAGDAVLLRADTPGRAEGVDGAIEIDLRAGAPIKVSETLGLSSISDGRMQTIGLFAVARNLNSGALRAGRVFDGAIATEKKIAGVIIPRNAIIRLDGAAWAYFQTGDSAFERRELTNPRMVESGWFIADGAKPGDRLVTTGAGALLAIERADEAVEAD